MGHVYSQAELKKYLDKLKKQVKRFNLSMRYYRDTKNLKEYKQVNDVFKQFKGMNVLDVGCHIGYYALKISSFANSVISIDIDKEVIKKAEKFKTISGVKNVSFKVISAFDLDDNFMEKYNIDAVFIHKTVGDFDSNERYRWPPEQFNKVFSLFKKHCDTVICNDTKIIKDFFEKEGFSVESYPSFRSNLLYVIKR